MSSASSTECSAAGCTVHPEGVTYAHAGLGAVCCSYPCFDQVTSQTEGSDGE